MSQENPLLADLDLDLDEVLNRFIFPIWLEYVYEGIPEVFGRIRAVMTPQQRATFSRYIARGPIFFHDFLIRGCTFARNWQPLDEPPIQLPRPTAGALPLFDGQHLGPSTSRQTQNPLLQTDKLPGPSNHPFGVRFNRPSTSFAEFNRQNRPIPQPATSKAGVDRRSHFAAQEASNQPSQAIASNPGFSAILPGSAVTSGGNLTTPSPSTRSQTIAPSAYSEHDNDMLQQAEIVKRALQANLNTIRSQNPGPLFRQHQAMNNTDPNSLTAAGLTHKIGVPLTPTQALSSAPVATIPTSISLNADTTPPVLQTTSMSELPAFPGLVIPEPGAAPQNLPIQNLPSSQIEALRYNALLQLFGGGTLLQNEALPQSEPLFQNEAHLPDETPLHNTFLQNNMLPQNTRRDSHPQTAARFQQMQMDPRLQQAIQASMATPRSSSAPAEPTALGQETLGSDSTSNKKKRQKLEKGVAQGDEKGDTNPRAKRTKRS